MSKKSVGESSDEGIPLKTALLWILISVIFISGLPGLWLLYRHQLQLKWARASKYQIVSIVQTGPEKEALKTEYLAELLNLSVDKPQNLYLFSAKAAEKKLLATPLIKEARVRKLQPGTLYIDYSIRHPVAYIEDYTNTAVDKEGVIFPIQPFLTPKNKPQIYLGIKENEWEMPNPIWGSHLEGELLGLAFDVQKKLLDILEDDKVIIKRIDVSKTTASSEGQREIVVILEQNIERQNEGKTTWCQHPRILRLHPDFYEEGLIRFSKLLERLQKEEETCLHVGENTFLKISPTIIDLRIPKLAFIQTIREEKREKKNG